jgi:glycosyltransferase involved in cell wall biosynthesis
MIGPQQPKHAFRLSVIIPAKNEVGTIGSLVQRACGEYSDIEILFDNDGSSDATTEAAKAPVARVIEPARSLGNRAAITTGTPHATGNVFVFLDAVGRYQPSDTWRRRVELLESSQRQTRP